MNGRWGGKRVQKPENSGSRVCGEGQSLCQGLRDTEKGPLELAPQKSLVDLD